MRKIITLCIAFISGFFCLPGFSAQLRCEVKLASAALPQAAYFLPESEALQLQKTINTYNVVRLKPGGNYSKALTVKLSSNQAIFGLNGTKLPTVIIANGSSNTILSGVSPQKISFEAGKMINNSCFNRISHTQVEVKNATLENNLFTDLSGITIAIDTSQKGYLKNNRFIRTMVHSNYPAITMVGDSTRQSSGNQFVWTNILTPHGDGIIIKNQQDISFIGLDAESWNWSNIALYPGMLNVLNTDFLSVFMANGGDHKNNSGQYFNLDANTVLLQGMRIGRTKNPGIILGNGLENLLTINVQDIGLQTSGANKKIIDFYKDGQQALNENDKETQPAALSPASRSLVQNALQKQLNTFINWEQPQFVGIANPAGDNWESQRLKQTDSSEYIQSLIERDGIAQLPAGIYYITKPLILKDGQGIIGAGADTTAIIATTPEIDLIVGGNHADLDFKTATFTLADITLQGGKNGINHDQYGSGKGAGYYQIALSHVTIRDMQNAGIKLDNINAWDNNFIDHVQFYRCKIAIKQIPDPSYVGGDKIGWTYLDKNVFYQTQFVENDVAIDWQAKRGNNLNAFINCLFKDNLQAINTNNSDSTFFANSVFETASAQPLLKTNRVTGFVNSYFTIKQAALKLFEGNVFCDHCVFDNRAANSSVIISPDSKDSYFVNSKLLSPTSQSINTGIILNSNFSANPAAPVINSLFKNQIAQPF